MERSNPSPAFALAGFGWASLKRQDRVMIEGAAYLITKIVFGFVLMGVCEGFALSVISPEEGRLASGLVFVSIDDDADQTKLGFSTIDVPPVFIFNGGISNNGKFIFLSRIQTDRTWEGSWLGGHTKPNFAFLHARGNIGTNFHYVGGGVSSICNHNLNNGAIRDNLIAYVKVSQDHSWTMRSDEVFSGDFSGGDCGLSGFVGGGDCGLGGLSSSQSLPKGSGQQADAYERNPEEPVGPLGHFFLRYQIALGALFLAAGVVVSIFGQQSVSKLKTLNKFFGRDLIGFAMYLGGAVVAATGMLLILQ